VACLPATRSAFPLCHFRAHRLCAAGQPASLAASWQPKTRPAQRQQSRPLLWNCRPAAGLLLLLRCGGCCVAAGAWRPLSVSCWASRWSAPVWIGSLLVGRAPSACVARFACCSASARCVALELELAARFVALRWLRLGRPATFSSCRHPIARFRSYASGTLRLQDARTGPIWSNVRPLVARNWGKNALTQIRARKSRKISHTNSHTNFRTNTQTRTKTRTLTVSCGQPVAV